MEKIVRIKRSRSSQRASVNLKDVAELAKVSTATVSRVLTGTAVVSDEVAARVSRALKESGYMPNGAARALASRRTMTIGAIVPSIENEGFSVAISALQRVLNKADYTLLLASSGYDPAMELREAQMLISRGIDGIVLVGDVHDPALIPLLQKQGVPIIETWTLSEDLPCVGFDNAEAARQITEYLVSLGHQRIAVIAGQMRNNDRAAARVEGIKTCLESHGLTIQTEWLIERPYRILEGRHAMLELMAAPIKPTAIICGNDQLAFGALIGATACGMSVPGDVSVVGFNDIVYSAYLVPSLTTIRVPAEEIGNAAGSFLLSSLAGEVAPRVTEIPVSLVVRGSTAPPPANNPKRSAVKKIA